MSEILTQAGAELRITANADGTYTACIYGQRRIFDTFKAAVAWCCKMRDQGGIV